MKNKVKEYIDKIIRLWDYCSEGVWRDTSRNWKVDTVKTINLSVRTFFNGEIQTRACAMTYSTLLAIVPALALIFAIGRGFGLQKVISAELLKLFPAQHQAVHVAINFVDTYLSHTSEGVFVGIGILFLLYTLISMIGSIENTFNLIWGVKQGRPLSRKITDYTAMLLILPIVMICASGITMMMSATLRTVFHFDFLTPVISAVMEITSWLLVCLFFVILYVLMPNTKVKFKSAVIPGIMAGIGYQSLQWIFITGQMYVAKYNAIYGSFSFLPLMLIWLQLVYMVMFAGAVICYSSQNIFLYSFKDAITNMAPSYYTRLTIAVSSVVVQRFVDGRGATTVNDIAVNYNMPPQLVTALCRRMVKAGVLSVVEIDPKSELKGYMPAIAPEVLTVARLFELLDKVGTSDFVPDFDKNFPGVDQTYAEIAHARHSVTSEILLKEIKILKHI